MTLAELIQTRLLDSGGVPEEMVLQAAEYQSAIDRYTLVTEDQALVFLRSDADYGGGAEIAVDGLVTFTMADANAEYMYFFPMTRKRYYLNDTFISVLVNDIEAGAEDYDFDARSMRIKFTSPLIATDEVVLLGRLVNFNAVMLELLEQLHDMFSQLESTDRAEHDRRAKKIRQAMKKYRPGRVRP